MAAASGPCKQRLIRSLIKSKQLKIAHAEFEKLKSWQSASPIIDYLEIDLIVFPRKARPHAMRWPDCLNSPARGLKHAPQSDPTWPM